jgi:hypothetical protein
MAHRVYSLKRAVGWDEGGSGMRPTRLIRMPTAEGKAEAAEPKQGQPKPLKSTRTKIHPFHDPQGTATDHFGAKLTTDEEDEAAALAKAREGAPAVGRAAAAAEPEEPSPRTGGAAGEQYVTIMMDMARPFGWNRDDLLVQRVLPGKHAETVGVQAGWRVVALNGVCMHTGDELMNEYRRIKNTMPAGSTLAAVTFQTPHMAGRPSQVSKFAQAEASTVAEGLGGGGNVQGFEEVGPLVVYGQYTDMLKAKRAHQVAELAQLEVTQNGQRANQDAQYDALLAARKAVQQARLEEGKRKIQDLRSSRQVKGRSSLPWQASNTPSSPPTTSSRQQTGQRGRAEAAAGSNGYDGLEAVGSDDPFKNVSERAKLALGAGLGLFGSSRFGNGRETLGVGYSGAVVHRYADEVGDIDE